MSQRKELGALKTLLAETDQILATKRMKILDDVTPDDLFSECRRFRYWLLRTWAADLPTIAFIGLNPSVADRKFDDNTVRKCQIFARQWGYGRLLMLNIYAFRATHPKDMRKAADRLDIIGGKRNSLGMLRQYLEDFKVKQTVAAWGRGHLRSALRRRESFLRCFASRRTKTTPRGTRCTSRIPKH